MSTLIKNACIEVARINMWDNKPVDATPMIEYQEKMLGVGIEALEHFRELGATEQDIADAIQNCKFKTKRIPFRIINKMFPGLKHMA